MEKNYNTDDFLAKWASGELSEAEKNTFRETEDFKYYQAILEGTDILEVPKYDKERLFAKVEKSKLETPKVISLFPKWIYGVAASVAILIGAFFFLNNSVNYETGFGEQMVITLPDNSEVILNSKSELTYDKRNWGADNRLVTLSGEAFFKVEKGTTFSVETAQGKVTVLGTQFTITSDKDVFEVICFEGKVKAETQNLSEVLTKGNAVRVIGNSFEKFSNNFNTPSWLQAESSFSDAPLIQVINALEKQYNISINHDSVDIDQRFSGSFTHDKLETALRTVFESMEITFTFENENTIVLSKK